MNKPVWTWTHTGEQGEELAECEGKYYTRHAWDHFLAAYTGKVRRVGRDRPQVDYSSAEFDSWKYAWSPHPSHATTAGPQIADDDPGWVDLFPDEPTDPMPQPVIRPRQLTPVAPLQKKDKP